MAQMGVGAPPGTIRRNKEPHHDQPRDNSISIKLPSRQRNREHYLHNSDAMNLQSDPINKSLIKNKPKLIKNVDFQNDPSDMKYGARKGQEFQSSNMAYGSVN